MNALVESGVIKELNYSNDFIYVLKDENDAISSDYKILKMGWEDYFVPCMSIKHNGLDALYYYVRDFKPLSGLETSLSQDQMLKIIKNIVKDIVDVRDNGFLSCQKIEFSADKIFIDSKNLRTVLTYVPISRKIYSDEVAFEDCVRRTLIELVSNSESIDTENKTVLINELKNVMQSLDTILEKLSTNEDACSKEDNTRIDVDKKKETVSVFKLVSTNAPVSLQFIIDKADFLLGRKKAAVDGAIEYNKLVGRVHCRLSLVDGNLFVQDLDSANGTYVNGIKLTGNIPKALNVGDILKLADTEFKVTM